MLRAIGAEMRGAIEGLGIADGIERYRLMAVWEEVVGEHLARQSEPTGVRDGQLLVRTTSPLWSQELLFRQPEILQRIHGLLENNQIRQLRCRVGKIQRKGFRRAPQAPRVDWSSVSLSPAALARVERMIEPLRTPELRASARKAFLQWEKRRSWAYSVGMKPCLLCGAMQEERLCFSCEREQVREREASILRLLGRQPWLTLRELSASLKVTQNEFFLARRRLRSIFERNYWNGRDALPAGAPFPEGLRHLMLDLCMLTTGVEFERMQERHILKTFGRLWGRAFLLNVVPTPEEVAKNRLQRRTAKEGGARPPGAGPDGRYRRPGAFGKPPG